jgi:hypothetical protein
MCELRIEGDQQKLKYLSSVINQIQSLVPMDFFNVRSFQFSTEMYVKHSVAWIETFYFKSDLLAIWNH